MNCPNCQAPVANGSLLCPNCGYHVATAYQRGKVNAMISGRPGVVKKSLRSGAFIFLAILMTIISVASLAVMVISIKDLIDTYNKFGSAIGGMTLLTTGITILFNILSFRSLWLLPLQRGSWLDRMNARRRSIACSPWVPTLVCRSSWLFSRPSSPSLVLR